MDQRDGWDKAQWDQWDMDRRDRRYGWDRCNIIRIGRMSGTGGVGRGDTGRPGMGGITST